MKWILSLLVIAALMGVLWFVSGGFGDGGTVGPSNSGGGIGPGNASPADLTPVRPTTPETEQAGTGRQAMSTYQASGTPGQAAENAKVEVQTVSERAQQPLADIDVWLLDRTQRPAAEWQAAEAQRADWFQYIKDHGVQLRTDEAGLAVFPATTNCAVYAEGSGMSGDATMIGPVSTPIVVTMRPQVDLEVLVTDAKGRPGITVPVAIFLRDNAGATTVVLRHTMANGVAQFKELTALLQTRRDDGEFAVGLAFPTRNPQLVPINPDVLPDEPIELQLPPCAPVLVRALGGDGEPMRERMSIAVGRSVVDPMTGNATFRPFDTRRTQTGETRLSFVEVGADVHLRFSGVRNLSMLETVQPGPPVPDEEHLMEVVWDLPLPTLVARLVDGAGNPLAGERGRMRLVMDGANYGGPGFVTEDDGTTRIVLSQEWQVGTIRTGHLQLTPQAGGSPLEGSIDLSFDVPPGRTDYGLIVLKPLPLLAAGRVLDPAGAPVVGAHLRIDGKSEDDPQASFVPLHGLNGTTTETGEFEVYGNDPGVALQLVARRRGFLQSTLPFVAGAKGLELSMLPGEDPSEFKGGDGALEGGDSRLPKGGF